MGYGMGGLFAMHTAAVSRTFHAVVAYDTRCDLTSNSIRWLSSSNAEIPTIVKQAGGTKAAYELVHQFEPESFMERMSAPTLLAYASWFGRTYSAREAALIRSSFEKYHKSYEWYELDLKGIENVKVEVYQAQFFTKIADYLDKTLK